MDEVKQELGLDSVVKLGSNESPYPPFPAALEAISGGLETLNRYPEDGRVLVSKIASRLGLGPASIILGHGSNELIRLFAQATLEPGNEVVFPTPSFSLYPRITRLFGARPAPIPLLDGRIDLTEMARKVTGRTKIVYLCNPNNPTGTTISRTDFEAFLDELPDTVWVVVDEAYREYMDEPGSLDAVAYVSGSLNSKSGPAVVALRTFSKMFSLAGLRIGYAAAPRELIEVAAKIRDPHNVNALAQVAAERSLESSAELNRRRGLNREGREFLCSHLERLNLSFTRSQTNFVWVDFGEQAESVFERLLQSGVIVRKGSVFGEGCDSHMRITVGTAKENLRLVEVLERIL